MSFLSKKDLHTPFNTPTITKILAAIGREVSSQATPADLTDTFIADHDGIVRFLDVFITTLPATGESMVLDVKVNGSSIIGGGVTIDDSTTEHYIEVASMLAAPVSIARGDVITIVRDYTAGGSAAPMTSTRVNLGWA